MKHAKPPEGFGEGGLPGWNVPGGQMHWPLAGLVTIMTLLTVHWGTVAISDSLGNSGV